MVSLLNADSLTMPLADGSVHMIATSPPYWGLRDYGLATWEGGDAGCDHVESEYRTGLGLAALGEQYRGGGHKQGGVGTRQYRGQCAKCGALQVSAGLGLEPLHDCLGWARGENCGACYVCRMRLFARECWRVLRDDGVMFLNLGDSYYGGKGQSSYGWSIENQDRKTLQRAYTHANGGRGKTRPNDLPISGLKPKDLVGIPWRVALALQADGWYLRSDIIWAKPNPMPESVTDRPTKAHEYVFLLTKRARYFWDADAVREEFKPYEVNQTVTTSGAYKGPPVMPGRDDFDGMYSLHGRAAKRSYFKHAGRNLRSVWNIATQPYSGAHFATWPEKLVEPMVKAGTSEAGCCPVCGKQWERVTEPTPEYSRFLGRGWNDHTKDATHGSIKDDTTGARTTKATITLGFRPTCDHEADPVPCTVLDPFAGSGTTGVVARRLGRNFVGLDLSFDYLRDQARRRLELDRLDDWHSGNGKVAADDLSGLPLFEVQP